MRYSLINVESFRLGRSAQLMQPTAENMEINH